MTVAGTLARLTKLVDLAARRDATKSPTHEDVYPWRGDHCQKCSRAHAHARPNQLQPDNRWAFWVIVAGRSWGKTLTGAEWVLEQARNPRARIALVGRTAKDVRSVMVTGPAGILEVARRHYPKSLQPKFNSSLLNIEFATGAVAELYSAEKPDVLRGPQFTDAWCDEIAAWSQPRATWDQLQFGMRLGVQPRCVITTTPRPIPLIRELLKASNAITIRGSTYENRANLPNDYFEEFIRKYEGTRLGRQEIDAEVLEDNPGALWQRSNLDAHRVATLPQLTRVVIAVDPTGGVTEGHDEAGIVAVGLGADGHGYVLGDLSGHYTAEGWAAKAVAAYNHPTYPADKIVAESNFGGDMVRSVIHNIDRNIPVHLVHASRGKAVRADPVAQLFEQGRCHFYHSLPTLEDELCAWDPRSSKDSPNRLDALVWGVTDLMLSLARPATLQGRPQVPTAVRRWS